MSSPSATPSAAAGEETGLSKAEIRRRKILAKRQARMALVTGDRTIATMDPVPDVAPAVSTVQPSVAAGMLPETATIAASQRSTPTATGFSATETAPPVPLVDGNEAANLAALFGGMDAAPSPRRPALSVPPLARNVLVVLCALLVPVLRSSVAPRASALQLFLAAEAVVLAPALATRGAGGFGGGGLLGVLSAAATASRAFGAVYRDAALFLLALFFGLRVAEVLL